MIIVGKLVIKYLNLTMSLNIKVVDSDESEYDSSVEDEEELRYQNIIENIPLRSNL